LVVVAASSPTDEEDCCAESEEADGADAYSDTDADFGAAGKAASTV
jgi:hypothetical protein